MSGIGSFLLEKLYIIPGIVVAISVHEYGHAKAAQLCGDRTSSAQGRVSPDPRAHIDIIGLLMLFFVGFGWGKPVLIDPRQFRHPRRDQIIVGLAGVFNNFVTSIVFALILRLYRRMRQTGGDVLLIHPRTQPGRVLSAAGIDRIMPVKTRERKSVP